MELLLPVTLDNTFARQHKFPCRMLGKSNNVAEYVIKLLFQD